MGIKRVCDQPSPRSRKALSQLLVKCEPGREFDRCLRSFLVESVLTSLTCGWATPVQGLLWAFSALPREALTGAGGLPLQVPWPLW